MYSRVQNLDKSNFIFDSDSKSSQSTENQKWSKYHIRTISWKSIHFELSKFEKFIKSVLIIYWPDRYIGISSEVLVKNCWKLVWSLMMQCSLKLQCDCLWKISIIVDMNKMQTRQNVKISTKAWKNYWTSAMQTKKIVRIY